jgi:hypothetical protein
MDGQQWKPPFHERSRQLLGCEEIDPAGSARLPDVWQEAIEAYMVYWREERTPIAIMPWHERVLTVEGLILATQRDHDNLWKFRELAVPACDAYKATMLAEIERITAIRSRLVPLEEADLAGAAERALVDGSDAGRLRLRYIGESQRDLLRLLKELREVDKHADKFPPGEPEGVAPGEDAAEPDAPRNEANEVIAETVQDDPASPQDAPVKPVRPKNPLRKGRKKR